MGCVKHQPSVFPVLWFLVFKPTTVRCDMKLPPFEERICSYQPLGSPLQHQEAAGTHCPASLSITGVCPACVVVPGLHGTCHPVSPSLLGQLGKGGTVHPLPAKGCRTMHRQRLAELQRAFQGTRAPWDHTCVHLGSGP